MRFSGILLLFLAMSSRGGEKPPRILDLTLDETPAALEKMFRQPAQLIRQPSWGVVQFHEPGSNGGVHSCDGDFEWEFYYSAQGQLESVTWSPVKPVSLETLFP